MNNPRAKIPGYIKGMIKYYQLKPKHERVLWLMFGVVITGFIMLKKEERSLFHELFQRLLRRNSAPPQSNSSFLHGLSLITISK